MLAKYVAYEAPVELGAVRSHHAEAANPHLFFFLRSAELKKSVYSHPLASLGDDEAPYISRAEGIHTVSAMSTVFLSSSGYSEA